MGRTIERHRCRALAAAAALALLASCEPSEPRTAAPTHAGVVEAAEGEAYVAHGGVRRDARAGVELDSGDRLETAAGKIRARLADRSILSIGAGTSLELRDLAIDEHERSGRIHVAAGKFWMQVTKWTGQGRSLYEIETPNAVAGVRGTTLWGDTEVDAICALEGTIEVRSLRATSLAPATLEAGRCAGRLSHGLLEPMQPTSQEIERYLEQVLIR